MANKRITDLPISTPLIGTEALVMDQESTLTVTGIDTVQTTLSSIQEFTLSAAPFINVTGGATFSGTSEFFGDVIMTSARTAIGEEAGRIEFQVTDDLVVEGPSEFNEDVEIIGGDLDVTTGDILSAGENLGDIFAYKGQFIQNGGGVEFIQRLTQAQYDAIGIPDPTILYIIVG